MFGIQCAQCEMSEESVLDLDRKISGNRRKRTGSSTIEADLYFMFGWSLYFIGLSPKKLGRVENSSSLIENKSDSNWIGTVARQTGFNPVYNPDCVVPQYHRFDFLSH